MIGINGWEIPPPPPPLSSNKPHIHEPDGRGVGYIDTYLLAAVRLTTGAALWTNNRRLLGVASELGLATASRGGS